MITLPTKPTRVEPVSSLTRFGGRKLAQTGRLFVEKDAPYNLHLSFEPWPKGSLPYSLEEWHNQ